MAYDLDCDSMGKRDEIKRYETEIIFIGYGLMNAGLGLVFAVNLFNYYYGTYNHDLLRFTIYLLGYWILSGILFYRALKLNFKTLCILLICSGVALVVITNLRSYLFPLCGLLVCIFATTFLLLLMKQRQVE